MYKRIIEIEHELEFLQVKEVLESNNIPVVSNQTNESPFLTLDYKQIIFQLIIPEEYSNKYFRLIDVDYSNRVIMINETKKTPKTKLWLYLMIGYSIIMSFLCLKYFDINRRSNSDKNYIYKWNYDNTELDIIHKETQDFTKYIDKNYDLNFEKLISFKKHKPISASIDLDENGILEEVKDFDHEGNIIRISFDKNQDGLFEEVKSFDHKGNIIGISFDKDQDGLIEEVKNFDIEGHLTSIWIDKNQDELFEEVKNFDHNGNISAIWIDKNQDGMFEKHTLILENQEKLEFVDENKNGLFELKSKN